MFANPFTKEFHKLHVYQTTLQSVSTICFCHLLKPFRSYNSNNIKRQGISGREEKILTRLASLLFLIILPVVLDLSPNNSS